MSLLSKFSVDFFRKNHARNVSFVANFDRNYGSAQPCLKKIVEKKPDWNKAVSDAEKIVGYTTSFMSLRWLLSDEVANVAMHMRKLVGTNHPLLKAAKGLIFNGKNNNMQAWGLIVLLLSKALGSVPGIEVSEDDKISGFLHTQRALAEVVEMIRTSHLIHKGLMNLEKNSLNELSNDMLFGNKIALLTGDYLLSNSCLELANLQNQELVELMSSAVRDLSESEFLGPRDSQNHPLPSPPKNQNEFSKILDTNPLEPLNIDKAMGNAAAEWTLRNVLESGNLLGKSCQGTLKLAGHPVVKQEEAFRFGKHLALAWQACLEIQTFNTDFTGSFSLVSAPVLFTLQHDHGLYKEIEKGRVNITDIDYEKVRKNVLDGPGIELTKKLQAENSDEAYEFLEKLPNSDARTALENILAAME